MAMGVMELVKLVESEPGIDPSRLAEWFGVSTRTLRTHVRRANASLGNAARIELKRGHGYEVIVDDAEAFNSWKGAQGSASLQALPDSPSERVSYLLNDLLQRTDWVTLDTLSDVLCVSRAAVSQNLRQVEETLSRFGLKLEKRPHYGIRVSGSEMGRRLCLASAVVTEVESVRGRSGSADSERAAADLAAAGDADIAERLRTILACVDEVLRLERFQISSVAHQNLIVHIAIATRRIESGHYVPMEPANLERIRGTREYAVAGRIAQEISAELGQELPAEEVAYVAIHLASKGLLPAADDADAAESLGDGSAIVIPDDVWNIVSRMLERVWQSFRFDFRDDLELRMNLARHIVPLSVRLTYHMNLQNPILSDIRLRFPLAYSMALDASSELAEAYGQTLSPDEAGYIAMAFALALERQKSEHPRKRILIVCASGVGSARLLEHRVRSEFADYIESIITCDINDVSRMDFSEIDYVFTTVPISTPLPVPVREVRHFLDSEDVHAMRKVFNSFDDSDVLRFFDERLFFGHLNAQTKRDAINALCEQVMSVENVSPDFVDQVWAREGVVPTCFGNGVAVPHPLEPSGSRAVVAVAVLDKPISWDGYEVSIIFMTIIARGGVQDFTGFYETVADLLTSRDAMRELIRSPTWDTLCLLVTRYARSDGRASLSEPSEMRNQDESNGR